MRGMLGENASPEAINRRPDGSDQSGGRAEGHRHHDPPIRPWTEPSSKQIEDLLTGAGHNQTLGIFGSTESAEFKEMAEG